MIYHYGFYQDEKFKHILKDKALKPANLVRDPDTMARYENRISGMNADEYWEHAYNYFYKPVVKKAYKNYGIYMTCLDLFGVIPSIKIRFNIPFERLKGDTVIQIHKNVKLVKSEKDIIDACKNFNADKIKDLWENSKFKFVKLPQIVNFSDSIPISKFDLEIYKPMS